MRVASDRQGKMEVNIRLNTDLIMGRNGEAVKEVPPLAAKPWYVE